MLADAIDFPMVFGLGLMVLVPLMAFEVFLEAFVLKLTWKVAFRSLCVFTLVANLLSLAAGIPTKILNAFFYGAFLPEDLPGFFATYPLAVCIGTLFYFAVTVAVEGGTLPPQTIRSSGFELAFPLPASLAGKPALQVAVEVSRTFRPPSDPRELGLAFGSFEVR